VTPGVTSHKNLLTVSPNAFVQVPYQVLEGKPTRARKMVPGPSHARKIGF